MLNLTRQERVALIFLTATFLMGLVISFYNTKVNKPQVQVISHNVDDIKSVEPININSASRGELEGLSGIGPSLAEEIVRHREKNGSFLFKEDIMKVKGIGKAKFESIKDSISVYE